MTELVKKESTNWRVLVHDESSQGRWKDQEWTGLVCGNRDQIVLAQRYIYIYTQTLIAEVNRKTLLTFMGQYEHSIWPGYHKVASLEVLNGSWSTKLIKYHGLKAFSRKQLNKLIILVVLLCPLYSIVYAIFKKQKISKMAFVSIC